MGCIDNNRTTVASSGDDLRVLFVGAYCRGQRREDQERDYLENYYPTDERVPRVRRLPDSRLVHVESLFSAEELKTSPTYNEMLRRTGGQDSMNARLDGPDSSSIIWGLRDPVASDGWGSSRTAMVEGLLPISGSSSCPEQGGHGRVPRLGPDGNGKAHSSGLVRH